MTHQLYKVLHVHRLEHHQLVLLLLGIIHGRQSGGQRLVTTAVALALSPQTARRPRFEEAAQRTPRGFTEG